MNETAIAWTDYTWNFFSGCKKVSPECTACYAHTLAERHRGDAAFPHGFDLTVRPHKLNEPRRLLKSKGPSLIFCESMSDIGLSAGELSQSEIERLQAAGFADMNALRAAFFDVIEATPEHRYQVLTKRPGVLWEYLKKRGGVPANVWIGVTIGHEKSLIRIEMMRRFRDLGARVLFVSAEPLLCDLAPRLDLRGIDWLIVGGESGLHASDPKHAERFLVRRNAVQPRLPDGRWVVKERCATWIRNLRSAAREASVPFFFKQWGGSTPNSAGRTLDFRTWDEMPTVPGAMPERRVDLAGAATAGLARKRLPVAP
jgi:protein gp37